MRAYIYHLFYQMQTYYTNRRYQLPSREGSVSNVNWIKSESAQFLVVDVVESLMSTRWFIELKSSTNQPVI